MSILSPEKPNYSISDIYRMTDNGLEIFKREIHDFSLNKNVKNPFQKDNNPSARIKQSSKSGLWLLYLYNEEGQFYNAISFLMRKYGLDLKGVINYIQKEQILNPIIEIKPTIKKRREIYFTINKVPFTQRHSDYFAPFKENFLNEEMDIFAIDYYYINGKRVNIPKNQFMFAYEFRDIFGNVVPGKYKLLTLGEVDKKNKWKNNIVRGFFYEYKIKDGDTVFVVKSNKDCIPLSHLGIPAIASRSENSKNIIDDLTPLMEKFPNTNFISNQGSDDQGFRTSMKITRELNIGYFNTPKSVLSLRVNDNWEYVKKFGIRSFENLLKLKKFV